MTGKNYHLPTELQWEYATRGNQDPLTIYPWGDEIGKNKANCAECGSDWDHKSTAPIGSFPAYGFGLYDTSGNVGEWVQDCDDATEAEINCSQRVPRGGSWLDEPVWLRSANRFRFPTGTRLDRFGFRLAQD